MESEKLDVFFEGAAETVVEVGGFDWVLLSVLVAMRAGNRRLASGFRQVRQAQIMDVLSSTALKAVSENLCEWNRKGHVRPRSNLDFEFGEIHGVEGGD